MSIAVSVCISPSRCLAVFMNGMAGFFLMTGVLISMDCIGPFVSGWKWIMVPLFILSGIFLVYHGLRVRKTLWLDISGNGQIRLREYRGYGSDAAADEMDSCAGSDVLTMAENSTIWSWLLILCLMSDSGRIIRIPIFFDSMRPDEFRALYTTCKWIGVHRKA